MTEGCISCEEGLPRDVCPHSEIECGHHHNDWHEPDYVCHVPVPGTCAWCEAERQHEFPPGKEFCIRCGAHKERRDQLNCIT